MAKSSNQMTTGDTVRYEPCVVTFVDILGFRNLLSKRPAAVVHKVIQHLRKFTAPDSDDTSTIADREISRAFAYTVSDAIVRVRPYETKFRDGALLYEILDLLHAQIELINHGVLIRGGIAVGDAYVGQHGEGPAFGPAIVLAYEIECGEAVYPRVVVDDDALKAHKTDKRLRSENNTLEFEVAELGKLLATGEDGTRFIDYLSCHSMQEFDSPALYLGFLHRHAELIATECKKEHPLRTHRKFEWLRRYHNREIETQERSIMKSAKRREAFIQEFEAEPSQEFKLLRIA